MGEGEESGTRRMALEGSIGSIAGLSALAHPNDPMRAEQTGYQRRTAVATERIAGSLASLAPTYR